MANVVQGKENKNEEVEETSSEKHVGWAGVHSMCTQNNKKKISSRT